MAGRRGAAVVDPRLLRILDANLNRAREGLRVCEDVVRLGFDDARLTRQVKQVRHRVTRTGKRLPVPWRDLLASRGAERDVGRPGGHLASQRRRTIRTLFLVNVQRVKEALRVLEEVSRIIAPSVGTSFAQLRFQVYGIEAA